MSQKSVLQTFASRYIILILNFGLVIFSANYWGSEGKGIISLLIADLTIVGIFTNILAGSSTSYFISKFQSGQVLWYAYLWSILFGLIAPFIFVFSLSVENLIILVILSVLSALFTTNMSYFVGLRNFRMYNLYSILQLVLHLVLIVILVFVLDQKNPDSYFKALIITYLILFLVSFFQISKNISFFKTSILELNLRRMLQYGWNIQFSSFLQFLNNRLSYYFIEFFKGISALGVFSVGVAFSEAIWVVSRSLSLVLYSEAVNTGNTDALLQKTKFSIKISFLTTLFLIVLFLIIPANFYILIFGADFFKTKEVILLLSPGILVMAVSNVIGFYFAGINKLRILNLKSIVGLLFTVVLSYFFIPKWGILGACLATTISYAASSFVLFYDFYSITTFSVQDFFISKTEIQLIWSKMKRR